MSPRRKIDPTAGDILAEPKIKVPRRWGFTIMVSLASLLIAGAIAASTLILISHESHRREAIRDVAFQALDFSHARAMAQEQIWAVGCELVRPSGRVLLP